MQETETPGTALNSGHVDPAPLAAQTAGSSTSLVLRIESMVELVVPGNNGLMLQPPALLHQSSVNVDAGTISDAREQLVSAVPASAPTSVQEDVALVFAELAVNVLRHSGVGPKEQLHVRMYGLPRSVRIEVEDPGDGFDLPAMLPLQDDGRWGLRLVEALATEWGMRAGVRPPTVMWCELPVLS